MYERAVAAIFVAIIVAVIALVVWWEVSIWGECRATNSFWYCVRILAR